MTGKNILNTLNIQNIQRPALQGGVVGLLQAKNSLHQIGSRFNIPVQKAGTCTVKKVIQVSYGSGRPVSMRGITDRN